MSDGPKARWFQLSLRTLFLATGVFGATLASFRANYPSFGLFIAFPFTVGLILGDVFPRGQKRAALVVASALVSGIIIYGEIVFFVVQLFSRDIMEAMEAVFSIEPSVIGPIAAAGAISAIAGSAVAQWLKPKPTLPKPEPEPQP